VPHFAALECRSDKNVDYELATSDTYEGVWHVEELSHEEIVATALYFERDEDIKGGIILFKRALQKDEAYTCTNEQYPAISRISDHDFFRYKSESL